MIYLSLNELEKWVTRILFPESANNEMIRTIESLIAYVEKLQLWILQVTREYYGALSKGGAFSNGQGLAISTSG